MPASRASSPVTSQEVASGGRHPRSVKSGAVRHPRQRPMKRPMNSKTAIACAALCLASASTSAALRDYVYTADWTDGLLAGQQARGRFTVNEEVFQPSDPQDVPVPIISNFTGTPLPAQAVASPSSGISFCDVLVATNSCGINPALNSRQTVITFLSGMHGNVFTYIPPDQYPPNLPPFAIPPSQGFSTLTLVPAMAVPEPGTYALLSMGLAAVSLARQRHRKTLADR